MSAIDRVASEGAIPVGEHQIRTRRFPRWQDPGNVGLGVLGVRFTSSDPRFVPDRLSRVLHRLFYAADHPLDPTDLSYFLELPKSAGETNCLDGLRCVDFDSTRDLVTRLVNSNRSTAKALCDELRVIYDADTPREALVESLLWKLGSPSAFQFPDLLKVREFRDALAVALAASEPENVIRGIGVNLFTKLEDTLQRALLFSSWAFTNDHVMDLKPFEYDPEKGWEGVDFFMSRVPAASPELRSSKQMDGIRLRR